jgi:hypothetical protein
LNSNKHLRFKQIRTPIDIPYIQGINKQCLFQFILCHNRYGHISLKSLSTWNKVFLQEKTFFCYQQYELIENKVSRDSFSNHMKLRLHKKGIDIVIPNIIDPKLGLTPTLAPF